MANPICITVGEFCALTGLKKTSCYRLLKEQKIEGRMVGRRRLILMSSVRALLDLREPSQGDS